MNNNIQADCASRPAADESLASVKASTCDRTQGSQVPQQVAAPVSEEMPSKLVTPWATTRSISLALTARQMQTYMHSIPKHR